MSYCFILHLIQLSCRTLSRRVAPAKGARLLDVMGVSRPMDQLFVLYIIMIVKIL